MTHEEFKKSTHDYLAKFLHETEDDDGDITGSIKCTLCQILSEFKCKIQLLSQEKEYITTAELMNAQIDALRQGIVDLQRVLYSPKEEIQ